MVDWWCEGQQRREVGREGGEGRGREGEREGEREGRREEVNKAEVRTLVTVIYEFMLALLL